MKFDICSERARNQQTHQDRTRSNTEKGRLKSSCSVPAPAELKPQTGTCEDRGRGWGRGPGRGLGRGLAPAGEMRCLHSKAWTNFENWSAQRITSEGEQQKELKSTFVSFQFLTLLLFACGVWLCCVFLSVVVTGIRSIWGPYGPVPDTGYSRRLKPPRTGN